MSGLPDRLRSPGCCNHAECRQLRYEAANALESESPEGERCLDCGRYYLTAWRVPDEVWATITPRPERPESGTLCLPCADRRLRGTGRWVSWGLAIERDELRSAKVRNQRLEEACSRHEGTIRTLLAEIAHLRWLHDYERHGWSDIPAPETKETSDD